MTYQKGEGMKYLTGQEVRELAVALELNRTALHPRGLALEYTVPTERNEQITPLWFRHEDASKLKEVVEFVRERCAGTEYESWGTYFDGLLERVQDAIDYPNVAVLRIQDHRDDPEGVYFDDLDDEDVKKADAFEGLLQSMAQSRVEALGYLVQPLPEPAPE